MGSRSRSSPALRGEQRRHLPVGAYVAPRSRVVMQGGDHAAEGRVGGVAEGRQVPDEDEALLRPGEGDVGAANVTEEPDGARLVAAREPEDDGGAPTPLARA